MDERYLRFLWVFGCFVVAALALYVEHWYDKVVFKGADYMSKEHLPSFAAAEEVFADETLRLTTKKLGEGKLSGPETVVFLPGGGGVMFTFSKDGTISRLESNGAVEKFLDLNDYFDGTRPLGAAFGLAPGTEDDENPTPLLYIADAVQGLVKISMNKEVELVSTKANNRKIMYANDVAVGPVSGNVYFTDSTDLAPYPAKNGSETVLYDTLAASIEDLLRSRRTGRLLKYNPNSGKTTEMLDGIWFANGVTVSKDEKYVLVCETFAARILKVKVAGDKARPEAFSRRPLPGYCDGINYSNDGNKVLVSIPTPPPKIVRLLKVMPAPLAYLIRCILVMLPPSLRPKPLKAGIVSILDETGKPMHTLSDPTGSVINMISAVTEDVNKPGRLLLGQLQGDFVGVVDYSF